jgi:hypothetical protein
VPTPCTVSGTLQTLSSGIIAQGQVIFQLTNIAQTAAGNTGIPRVTGTAIIPNTQLNVMTDQSGNFTISLWGNDNITPAGTVYNVTFKDFLKNEVGPIVFSITGATFNLNTATNT